MAPDFQQIFSHTVHNITFVKNQLLASFQLNFSLLKDSEGEVIICLSNQ